MIDIRPSILAADPLNMERDIARLLPYGISCIHFDVMDAHFVPNLSFGPDLCKAVKKRFPELSLDVHLMMSEPERYTTVFSESGADSITFHIETVNDAAKLIGMIHTLGKKAGLSVKPNTAVETLLPYIKDADQFLIMTVEPGFGGQHFMPEMLDKAKRLREGGYRGLISIDGGVGMSNAVKAAAAGVNAFVMGTSVFKTEDPGAVIGYCREADRYEQ